MAGRNQKQRNNEWLRLAAKTAGGVLLSVLFIVILWIIAHAVTGNDYLVPSLSATLKAGVLLLRTSAFRTAFFSTFLRATEAFFIAFVPAVFLAVVSYVAPPFRLFLSPLVSLMRSLPTMAVLLILLVFSSPAFAPVLVAFLALFPMLYTAVTAALEGVDKELVAVCKVYRVPLAKRIFQMYLPLAAPYILREGSGALSFSVKLIVSAEVMANTYRSLGGLLQDSKIYTDMPQMFALTVFTVLLGLALEGAGILLARLAERRVK